MLHYKTTLLLLAISICITPTRASAHIQANTAQGMLPRQDNDDQKTSDLEQTPCGPGAANQPTTDPAKRVKLTGGQQFTIYATETIDHASKYRIAFSPDATDTFHTVLFDDTGSFDNDALLPTNGVDKTGGEYAFEITVPNIECDQCALQLLQKMFDGGNLSPTIYVVCMDIAITAKPAADPAKPSQPQDLKVTH